MSKNDIDLNIDNYNINDLLLFLNLKKNYTANDVDNKEKEYILNVVSNNTNTLDSQKKYDLIMFIKNAKAKLLENINSYSTTGSRPSLGAPPASASSSYKPDLIKYNSEPGVNPNNGVTNPNVGLESAYKSKSKKDASDDNQIQLGQIINPFGNIPSMQFSNNAIKMNGYNENKIIRNYLFNTKFRDDYQGSISTNSTYTLPQKMSNIISIDLSGIQYPNFAFSFSSAKKTNQIYIFEDDTENEAFVTIPSGNYNFLNFPAVLEKAINEQVVGSYTPGGPNRFTVSISEYTFFTTITNSTYTFTMVTNFQIYNDDPDYYECPDIYATRYFKSNPDIKNGIRPEQLFNSMGWQIGYRLNVYTGLKSYESEGHFDNTYSDYIYFAMNDFVNNQTSNTYGVLGGSILDNNILAVIPITTPYFTSTFDNNSNFIYKTRNYTGPVNITKINIQLLNEFGEQINLHNTDFTFCLQVTSIMDPY